MSRHANRPYQITAYDAVQAALAESQSALVVMPTGTGKTELYLDVAVNRPTRSVILAHRDFLLDQPIERLARKWGVTDVAVEKAERQSNETGDIFGRAAMVFASVQSLSRQSRLDRFDPAAFGLLIVDEAHRSIGRTYRKVIDHFARNPDLKIVGLTATPKRADGLAMGQVYQSVAYEYGINEAIDDGWLCPLKAHKITVGDVNLDTLKMVRGDFSEEELEKLLVDEPKLHAVAKPLVERTADWPTIVFGVRVNHVRALAEVINRYKSNSAVALWGESTDEDRADVLRRFRNGEVQYLVNCGLFTEGFDAPGAVCCAWARMTKSLVLYTQGVGRVFRTATGTLDGLESCPASDRQAAIAASAKPYAVVLDFVGNTSRHKLITAVDLLGGKHGEPVRAQARKIAEHDAPGVPVDELLARAEAELELQRELEARRKALKAKVDYGVREVDPFGRVRTTYGSSSVTHEKKRGDLTPGQLKFLVSLGVTRETAQTYGRRQAHAVIDSLLKRRKAVTR